MITWKKEEFSRETWLGITQMTRQTQFTAFCGTEEVGTIIKFWWPVGNWQMRYRPIPTFASFQNIEDAKRELERIHDASSEEKLHLKLDALLRQSHYEPVNGDGGLGLMG